MSVYAGPEFNESGLIYYHDMNNKKSYAGAPTTNHVTNADTMPGWNTYGGTPVAFQTEFGTTGYKMYNAPSWNGIYKTVTVPVAGTYTFSAWIRYLGGSPNNNGGTVYISGYGGGDVNTAVNKNIIGQWQRVSRTVTTTTTSMTFYLISYGGTNNGSSDYSSWEVTMPQVEAGSATTTWLNGTRSSTQVLRDLTGLNTITANLTHNTDNTFSFNGSSNFLQVPYSATLAPTTGITMSVWATTDWQTTSSVRFMSRTEGGGWQLSINDDPAGNRVGMTIHVGGTYRYCTVPKSSVTAGYHNLVGTCNGRYLNLYIDGIVVNTIDLGSVLALTYSANNDLIIGAEAGGSGPAGSNFISGSIPVSQIYNRALSAAEVYSNYTALRLRYGI